MKTLLLATLILFSSLSCGTTHHVTVIDSVGRLTPDHSSKIASVTEKLYATFWYVTYASIKDADGTTVKIPVFIDTQQPLTLNLSKYRELELHIEIHNPTLQYYQLTERLQYGELSIEHIAASSILRYRKYKLDVALPSLDTTKAVHSVIVFNAEGKRLFVIGSLKYSIKGRR